MLQHLDASISIKHPTFRHSPTMLERGHASLCRSGPQNPLQVEAAKEAIQPSWFLYKKPTIWENKENYTRVERGNLVSVGVQLRRPLFYH